LGPYQPTIAGMISILLRTLLAILTTDRKLVFENLALRQQVTE
jgi:hypothetical protein